MADAIYVQLAPIRLKDGIDERALLEASDAFQKNFVSKQAGIRKRVLLRARHGGYADLVFFESKEDAERIAGVEATSAECMEFFKIIQAPDETLTDMGILSFEHMRTYE
jgi:hypothetical protein